MKVKTIIASLAIIGLTFSGISYAVAKDGQCGGRGIIEQLSPEQQEKFEDMRDAQFEQIRPVMNELKIKRMEYKAFVQNPNVQPEQISKLAREIVELENKTHDSRNEFKDKVEKEFGIDLGKMGKGHGKGHNKEHGKKQDKERN